MLFCLLLATKVLANRWTNMSLIFNEAIFLPGKFLLNYFPYCILISPLRFLLNFFFLKRNFWWWVDLTPTLFTVPLDVFKGVAASTNITRYIMSKSASSIMKPVFFSVFYVWLKGKIYWLMIMEIIILVKVPFLHVKKVKQFSPHVLKIFKCFCLSKIIVPRK